MKQPHDRSVSFGRLLRRADFMAAAKGARARREAFGLQACERTTSDGEAARFGLTVTKKTAPRAVDRNRMKRRLRAALRAGVALSGDARHDYVIVGREGLLTMPFAALRAALEGAFAEVRRKMRDRKPPGQDRASREQAGEQRTRRGRAKAVPSAKEAGA